MSNYIGKLVNNLQNSNMQKHMGKITDEISPRHEEISNNIVNYEYQKFIDYIFKTALDNRGKYYQGQELREWFNQNADDLIPIFTKMNEDCLNDSEFSNAIFNGTIYTKNMGYKNDYVLFNNPIKTGSSKHGVVMNLLFIPSITPEQPNRFRIDVKEQLQENHEYPFISFSVDIADDGSITYNQPEIVDKHKQNDDEIIVKRTSDMSLSHLKFNDIGINNIGNILMEIFEKTGIKEDTSNKHR